MNLKEIARPLINLGLAGALFGGLIWYVARPNKLVYDKPVFKDSNAIGFNETPAWIYEGHASILRENVKFLDQGKDGILDAVSYSKSSNVEITEFLKNDKNHWHPMWSQILQYEKDIQNKGSKLPEKNIEF